MHHDSPIFTIKCVIPVCVCVHACILMHLYKMLNMQFADQRDFWCQSAQLT